LSEVEIFSLGAASCRDDRGCSPPPQGRHFIADRTAQCAVTRFLRRLQNWQNEMNLERKVDLNTRGFLSITANAFYPRPKCSMTQHDTTVRIRHMLDHAKEAVDLLDGKEKAGLSCAGSWNLLSLGWLKLLEKP
jgi:hypothetical protein